MQPGDANPKTLAFATEGGNVKIYNDGTINGVNGVYSGNLTTGPGSVEDKGSLVFDGINDYVELGDVPLTTSMTFLMSMTLNKPEGSENYAFFAKNGVTGAGNFILIGSYTPDLYYVSINSTPFSVGALSYNKKINVAIVIEASGSDSIVKIYENGVLITTQTITELMPSTTGITSIGADHDTGPVINDFLNGSVWHTSIWDTNLTLIQINDYFDNGVESGDANLVAAYNFDDTSTTVLTDEKAGYDGTISGATRSTQIGEGFIFRVLTNDDSGVELDTPIWDVLYNGVKILDIDAETGIVSTNNDKFKINRDGTIEAVDGTFSGTITGSTITGSTIEAQESLSVKYDAEWVFGPITTGLTTTLANDTIVGSAGVGTSTITFNSRMYGTISVYIYAVNNDFYDQFHGNVIIKVNGVTKYTSGAISIGSQWDSWNTTQTITVAAGDIITINFVSNNGNSGGSNMSGTLRINEVLGSLATIAATTI